MSPSTTNVLPLPDRRFGRLYQDGSDATGDVNITFPVAPPTVQGRLVVAIFTVPYGSTLDEGGAYVLRTDQGMAATGRVAHVIAAPGSGAAKAVFLGVRT